jgi:hypothetical protein
MQLSELEITKQLKKRGPVHWQKVVNKHGWTLVGWGNEAVVVGHPEKPYVLRIFSKDTPYVDWVNLVKSHQENPHFPKFSRYVRPIPGTEMNYVRMEILKSITQNQLMKDYLPELAYLWIQSSLLGLQFDLDFAPTVGVYLRELSRGSIFDKQIQNELWEKIGKPDSSWKQAIDLLLTLHQKAKKWPSDLDMHHGNFMLRGNILVISDPLKLSNHRA